MLEPARQPNRQSRPSGWFRARRAVRRVCGPERSPRRSGRRWAWRNPSGWHCSTRVAAVDRWPDNFAQRARTFPAAPSRPGAGRRVLRHDRQLDGPRLRRARRPGTGRQVVAECGPHSRCPGGGRFADEELHLWTFNDAGKVTRLRHHCDTAKHIAASRGEDTTTAVWTWRRTLSGRRGPTEQLAFTKAKGRLRG